MYTIELEYSAEYRTWYTGAEGTELDNKLDDDDDDDEAFDTLPSTLRRSVFGRNSDPKDLSSKNCCWCCLEDWWSAS